MKKLKISKEIFLPLDAVTQTIAAIGRKGAGKTYLSSMIAEQMLDAKAQVVVIDPIGNWYGLRIGEDGKSKGKDIFVIGGQHGDIPIIPEAGAKIARLLVDKNISVVLDISEFRLGERKRFATDFAEELLHQKKMSRTPVHIFIEEAQLFIPQRVGHDEARMVGAFEQIVRLGRNYGIGATLITQRPQSVNKEVLSQVECLCVLQVTGPHERKALEYWVQEAGADRTLVGELPSLERGEGYVWSPAWLKIFKKVKFAKKTTFDTSATPVVGKIAKAAQLSTVDIKKLRTDMEDVVAEAEKDDPKALRKKIVELQRESKKGKADPAAIEKAVAVAEKKKEMEFAARIREQKKYTDNLLRTIQQVGNLVGKVVPMKEITIAAPKIQIHKTERVAPIRQQKVEGTFVDEEMVVKPSQQRILNALLWGESVGIAPMDKSQLALMSDQKPTSGGYFNNLGSLRSGGYIDYPSSGMVQLTDEGRANADVSDVPTTDEELHSMLFSKLTKSQVSILQYLIEIYPNQVSKNELAEETGQSPTSGGYFNNLGRLRTLKLIDYPSAGEVHALPVLFIE